MSYLLTEFSLNSLFVYAAELGAKQALCAVGILKPYMTKAEAFRLFGRKNIEHWLELGLITPRKDGGQSARWRIDRLEAESIKYALELLRIF